MSERSWGPFVRSVAGTVEGSEPEHSRIIHTKGTTLTGSFHAPGVPPRPAMGRFSGTLGGAHGHDADSGDQGILLRIDGSGDLLPLNLALFSLPAFFVRSAADMLEFLTAGRAAASDPGAMDAFLARHPEAAQALNFSAAMPPPRSFADLTYHSVHAYGIRVAGNNVEWRRIELHPEGLHENVRDILGALVPERPDDPHYLHAELRERPQFGFQMVGRAPAAGEIDDVTTAWTGSTRPLGRLSFDAIKADRTPTYDLSSTGEFLLPRDQLFVERVALYSAAQRMRAPTGC